MLLTALTLFASAVAVVRDLARPPALVAFHPLRTPEPERRPVQQWPDDWPGSWHVGLPPDAGVGGGTIVPVQAGSAYLMPSPPGPVDPGGGGAILFRGVSHPTYPGWTA